MQAARRNLLKTGLMCTGAAAAAGVSLPASAAVEPKSKIAREEWDVVVVGAGFAGLCAALEAKEKGAKVLLIEKMGRPDCTSAYSSGWIAATKTRYQDKDDDDSKELYFKEMMEVSGGRSDPALIRAYAEIAGESVDWLGDHGMTYKIWKQHAPERMRCHIVPAVNGLTGGAHMVKVMLEALEKAGVPVRYNTKAVELVTDECFNVLGVSCIEKHRRVELMTKGGVILATGGFAGNNAMVGQYIGPWASRMVVRGAPWATGENIRMAEQVMARMVNMDQFYAGPISPVGHCNPSPLMHAGYGIQINTDGRRFVQEHLGQIEKAVGIASLTKNNMSYLLIGQDADANNNILSNTLTRFEKLGLKVASGKTIEEAVKQAGLPVEAVMETVAEYNKAVREGKTAELVPPYLNEHPHELKTGPFYLVPAVGGIANGGVMMTPHFYKSSKGDEKDWGEGERAISEDAASQVTSCMQTVVSEGTGVGGAVDGYDVAGKTGTAERADENGGYLKENYMSSFMGFAPAQSPKVLCYITLDGTPSGSDAAAVPFQSIMANALDVLGIPHTK